MLNRILVQRHSNALRALANVLLEYDRKTLRFIAMRERQIREIDRVAFEQETSAVMAENVRLNEINLVRITGLIQSLDESIAWLESLPQSPLEPLDPDGYTPDPHTADTLFDDIHTFINQPKTP